MTRALTFLLAALLLAPAAFGNECETAGTAAEQSHGLPHDLLVAIGRVESGRRGPEGRVAPWPWSVNAAGQGYYLGSSAEAIGLVQSLQARGIRSIDVGCFQVNLMFHPSAFATLQEAFDPIANARAAADFLAELRSAVQDWEAAIGRYHSADVALGLPYMRQVMASWHGGATMSSPPLSQVAALVRVIVPMAFAAVTPAIPSPPLLARTMRPALRSAGARLPVVIVPTASRL